MIVLRTIAERWYVAVFLAAYVVAGVRDRGWKRTIRFGVLAFAVGFVAEYSSTRNGFPFTDFAYTGRTRGDELYLSNIPLFVPISYGVMMYAGRALGLMLVRRGSGALVVAGALCTMAVDIVVDPVAVRGDEWFLGDLFHYGSAGHFFGVPLGNFAGWVLVSAVVIGLDLLLDRGKSRTWEEERLPLAGVALAAAVVAFNVIVGVSIGAPVMALTSLAAATAVIAMTSMAIRVPARAVV